MRIKDSLELKLVSDFTNREYSEYQKIQTIKRQKLFCIKFKGFS